MEKLKDYSFLCQPKIISGNKALEGIPLELSDLNASKPLVLAMNNLSKKHRKTFINSFGDSNMSFTLFDGIGQYAGVTAVREAANLFRERGCDALIALGDGPVMNIAKGANILISNEKHLHKLTNDIVINKHMKPLIYVPLGASQGYESTSKAEIDLNLYESPFLYPDLIVIDNRMVSDATKEEMYYSALIALTGSIEASSLELSNPMTDSYAHASLAYINENLTRAVKKRKKDSCLAMANGAIMGNIAYSNAPEGIVYSTSKTIERLCGHSAAAVAGLLLPHWLEIKSTGKKPIRDVLMLALGGFDAYSSTPAKERGHGGVNLLEDLINNMEGYVPMDLKSLNIPQYRLKEIADYTTQSKSKINKKDILTLLERAYDREEI
ncbi:MAG: iron-containing alcohol dehydrogenase [Bacteroidales bacterium]|jgi:alcohol dehydrogenase|nr:iron-containing alcohol dehydrogenase [Bacteroidales bacterium]